MKLASTPLTKALLLISLCSLFSCGGIMNKASQAEANDRTNINTKVYDLPGSHWAQVGIEREVDAHLLARITDKAITKDIVDSGKVMVYFKSAGKWEPLPFTRDRGSYFFRMNYEYGPGYIHIMRYDSDLVPVSNHSNEGEYKVVIATKDGLKQVANLSLEITSDGIVGS